MFFIDIRMEYMLFVKQFYRTCSANVFGETIDDGMRRRGAFMLITGKGQRQQRRQEADRAVEIE